MSKDVKIEIIYYKSDTDVSLEFGLHGNYPVRLLSSSSNDVQSFFNHLKRAILRSEIIITVGGYSDDEFMPTFISKAIGKKTSVPQYGKLGVIAKKKYALPEGAIPLAPDNKIFGGFLIESGPQTIISLTDDKNIRLKVVNEVVVKYIEEHHNFYANGYAPVVADNIINNDVDKNNVVINNFSKQPFAVSNSFDTVSEVDNKESIQENEKYNIAIGVELPIVTEDISTNDDKQDSETTPHENVQELPCVHNEESVDIISQNQTNEQNNILNNISPDDFNFNKGKLTEPDDDEDYEIDAPVIIKTRPHRRFLRVWCIILSLLIILTTCVAVFIFNRHDIEDTVANDYYGQLAKTFENNKDNLKNAFDALKQYNNDIEAWITVDGTDINFPVLNVEQIDNKYFKQLPDGTQNLQGSIFTTAPIGNEKFEQNSIVYGSAENNIGIFSAIVDLFKYSDITQINYITIYNSFSKTEWRVVSMFTDSEADGFMYDVDSFDSQAKYTAFVKQVLRHNRTNQKAQLDNENSPLLTLIAKRGVKHFVVCAAPYKNVSYIKNENSNNNNSNSSNPGILIDINNAIIDFIGKTDENTDEFEQKPGDPDNEITLPPIEVTPPGGDSSSESSTTSPESSDIPSNTPSENTPSKDESASSDVSNSSPSDTPSNEQNSSDASSDTSSEVDSSDNSSDASSGNESVGSSSESSSDNSTSDATSSDNSSVDSSDTSSNTSSDTSSNDSTIEKPNVDPLYTWDITLYVKQSNGTIVYGKATDIVARVVEAEMGSSFPLEALKAQSVAAYCWLITNGATKSKTAPSGVPMKQKPLERCIQAVNEVKGTLVAYNGKVAQTYYYAYSAGYTANSQDIWTDTIPYLQSVECPVDTELSKFITTRTYTADEVQKLIKQKCDIDVSEMDKNLWIVPVEYDQNNAYCTTVEIGGVRYRGKFLRSSLFGTSKIRSSAYTVQYDSETDTFTITCKGWGHGVGMSQEGAKGYANLGWTYDQILAHFYPGTTIINY